MSNNSERGVHSCLAVFKFWNNTAFITVIIYHYRLNVLWIPRNHNKSSFEANVRLLELVKSKRTQKAEKFKRWIHVKDGNRSKDIYSAKFTGKLVIR